MGYLFIIIALFVLNHIQVYFPIAREGLGHWLLGFGDNMLYIMLAYLFIVALRRSGDVFNYFLHRIVPAIVAQIVILAFAYFAALDNYLNILLRVNLHALSAFGLVLLFQTLITQAPSLRENLARFWKAATGTQDTFSLAFRPMDEAEDNISPSGEAIFQARDSWTPYTLTRQKPVKAVLIGLGLIILGVGLSWLLDNFYLNLDELFLTFVLFGLHAGTAYPDQRVPQRQRRRRWLTIFFTLALGQAIVLLITLLMNGNISDGLSGLGFVAGSALFFLEDPHGTKGPRKGSVAVHWLYVAFLLIVSFIAHSI